MSHKVLLIDDDELMLISVKSLLESEGYVVTTASSGAEALDKAGCERYDVFLLDIIMPGMSGFEVCKSLRAMTQYNKTPIVMLTAKSAETDRQEGMEAGATQFLPKPVSPDKLLEVIRTSMRQGG